MVLFLSCCMLLSPTFAHFPLQKYGCFFYWLAKVDSLKLLTIYIYTHKYINFLSMDTGLLMHLAFLSHFRQFCFPNRPFWHSWFSRVAEWLDSGGNFVTIWWLFVWFSFWVLPNLLRISYEFCSSKCWVSIIYMYVFMYNE